MGNKPHRIKKMQMKALRKFNKIDVSEDTHKEAKKVDSSCKFLKTFSKKTATEMLKSWKKTAEHVHLKTKPHHHKRTTPGSLDEEKPMTMTGHHDIDKSMKNWHKGDVQKSSDLGRKHIHRSWKKAA